MTYLSFITYNESPQFCFNLLKSAFIHSKCLPSPTKIFSLRFPASPAFIPHAPSKDLKLCHTCPPPRGSAGGLPLVYLSLTSTLSCSQALWCQLASCLCLILLVSDVLPYPHVLIQTRLPVVIIVEIHIVILPQSARRRWSAKTVVCLQLTIQKRKNGPPVVAFSSIQHTLQTKII